MHARYTGSLMLIHTYAHQYNPDIDRRGTNVSD